MDRWAGPLFGSLLLGRFRAEEARPELPGYCFLLATSHSELKGPSQEEQKGKYSSKELFPPLVKHVKMNMDFPEDEVPDTSGSVLRQFQSSVPVDVPIHPCSQEVIKREWRDPDKILLPHFIAKLYPLQDMAQVLPDLVPIDSFVASLVGRTSLAEDAVIQDTVDKKVDVP
ncbi:hypothetical protein NDU88_002031 [Pleurodeles waltl]|uniref:Uncharacterized protein n=1 Tax=Pleurodeles waltl TaxID=8319 RepID=A0AAV7WP57_PLEWA|nr:hypothetical protein NDU88_002031 [Pleurodeles waltl]